MARTGPDDVLTPGQAVALVPISARTLRRYAATGRVASLVLPSGRRRYRRRDVLALIGRSGEV